MRPIGGYFELELPHLQEYHSNALRLNTGRNCLEYILRCRKYTKVYIPYFTCDTVVEPLRKLSVPYSFYRIDKNYRIVDDIMLKNSEALLYTNYWGLQGKYCIELTSKYGKQLIMDYTQAFFARPIDGIDTFYSCRKFFGVPDGGYVYTDCVASFEIFQDESWQRMNSLIKRIDLSPEGGYDDFHKISAMFHSMPVRYMSKLTKRLMQGINYECVAQKRIDNYQRLCQCLGGRQLNEGEVPMVFPYITDRGQELRKHLITNRVFVAKYWPNVEMWSARNSTEVWIANHVLPLPIDQRYGSEEMDYIIKLLA